MEISKIKSLTDQLQLLLKTNKEFPQKLKQHLVLESHNVTNHYEFIGGLFTEGVLCDGSSDPQAVFGFREMIAQHAMMIACSKGANAIGGLMKALEESGNVPFISALCTWAKQEFGIETDDDSDLKDQNEGASAVQSPATKQLPKSVTRPTESSSIGAKVIDKIMSRVSVEDNFMEQLEGHFVGKASEIFNAAEFFASLVHQNVLEETEIQLVRACTAIFKLIVIAKQGHNDKIATKVQLFWTALFQTTTPDVQEWQPIEKVIQAAWSKRAIGSLVLALQSSKNERILAETFAWLETSAQREKNHPIAVKRLANRRRRIIELLETGLQTTDYLTVEAIPTEDAKEKLEEKWRRVSQYCLTLPTILRQILQNFSNKELIQLSLENKLWNFEARSVMRERGTLKADASKGRDDTCKRLVAFASDLEKMPVVPFSGIHIKIYHRYDCQMTSDGSLDPSYKVILDRLPWKCLSVRFLSDWKDCKDCPALALVEKILQDYCGVLEELTLNYGREKFNQNIFHGRSFPSLKTLIIEPGDLNEDLEPWTSTLIRTLVFCAPKLQELYVKSRINLQVNVLRGSSAMLVPDYRFCPMIEPICEGLIGSVRAKYMEIRIQNDEIDPLLLNTYIPKLLEASRHTLKTLFMDLLFAVPLMSYGICFENVSELRIIMNGNSHRHIEPSILALTRGLDFTRIFPKLNKVYILNDFNRVFSSYVVDAFVERGNAALRNALPDRATNIKLLKFFHFTSIQRSTIRLLAQIFPDVKKLEFIRTPSFPFNFLQTHFRSLEEET